MMITLKEYNEDETYTVNPKCLKCDKHVISSGVDMCVADHNGKSFIRCTMVESCDEKTFAEELEDEENNELQEEAERIDHYEIIRNARIRAMGKTKEEDSQTIMGRIDKIYQIPESVTLKLAEPQYG